MSVPPCPPPPAGELDLGALTDQELLEVAEQRLPLLREWLRQVRGVALRGPVRLAIGPAQIERLPAPAGEQALLRALGLETPGAPDLLDPALVRQTVAATYQPESRTIVLHPAGLSAARADSAYLQATYPLDSLLLHELTHALQLERFPELELRRRPDRLPPEGALSGWLLEGEASYVEMIFECAALRDAGAVNGATQRAWTPAERYSANHYGEVWFQRQLARRSAERMGKLAHLGGELGEHGARAQQMHEVLERLTTNLYARYATLERYQKGAFFVQRIQAAHGWAEVDALFARPHDLTTEQALHPEVHGRIRPPARLGGLPWPEGWTPVAMSTLGERNLRTLCETLGADPQDEACAGWGGDRVQLARRGEERLLLWQLVWDSESDAIDFARAIRPLLRPRPVIDYESLSPEARELLTRLGQPESVEPCPEFMLDRAQVRQRGRRVWIAAARGSAAARPFQPWQH